MTVSTTIATKTYDGDGVTGSFPTGFAFFSAGDIEVVERVVATGAETVKALTTDYTVAGGAGSTGTVTALAAPPSTVTWTVRRVLSETQETDLPVAGSLPSDAVEQMVDRTVMMVQQHSEQIGRALAFPKTDPDTLSPTLPNSVDRANRFLKFAADGSLGVSGGTTSVELGFADGSAAAPAITFLDDPDSGLYRVGEDNIGITIGGSKVLDFSSIGLGLPDGSAVAPALSFINDRDTGVYLSGTGQFAVSVFGDRVTEFVSGGGTLVNFFQVTGRQTGFPPKLAAQGSDTDIDIELAPKESGLLKIGNSASWVENGSAAITITNVGPSAIGTATIAKWLNIKDNSGNDFYIPVWT